MSQPLYRIRNLIKELPGKDAQLAAKFLEQRNFSGIMELVESDIFKAKKNADPFELVEKDSEVSVHIDKLLELKANLDEYMSYLDIPDNSEELYEDCL